MKSTTYISLLKAEIFKTKNILGIWILILFPAVISIITAVYLLNKSTASVIIESNPWIIIFGRYLFIVYAFLFPLIVAIGSYAICEMEYKNQNFKQLFVLPSSKFDIYCIKMFLLTALIFISVFIAYISCVSVGYFLGYSVPNYRFVEYNIPLNVYIYFSRLFIGVCTIAYIQYFLSILVKNFALPVGTACFGVVFFLVANRWKYIDFIPYRSCYSAFEYLMKDNVLLFSKVEYINFGYIIIFFFLSYWIFRRINT